MLESLDICCHHAGEGRLEALSGTALLGIIFRKGLNKQTITTICFYIPHT